MAFESVVQSLHPMKVVVWGEQAMVFLGVGTLLNSYMLIPSESDFDLASQKLAEAGFRRAPWSYGITDPHLLPDDEIGQRIARQTDPMNIPGYRMLDNKSARFQFPAGHSGPERVVLLRSTYVGLSPPNNRSSMQRFHCHENLYYPDKASLLESFIRTLLKDSSGFWRDTLECWAISYIYGILMVEDTVLDSCDEESVRLWFNEMIRRGDGGLDRTTVSKRVDNSANRIADVRLADFGSTYHVDSKYAKRGASIGAPIWRSPEALFKQPWNTASDVWSFGALLISLIYGGDFNPFDPPDVPYGHEEYEFGVLLRQFQLFGPFPESYHEIVDSDTIEVVLWLMENFPADQMNYFHLIAEREVSRGDKDFICWVMKLDPRQRPTVRQILEHD